MHCESPPTPCARDTTGLPRSSIARTSLHPRLLMARSSALLALLLLSSLLVGCPGGVDQAREIAEQAQAQTGEAPAAEGSAAPVGEPFVFTFSPTLGGEPFGCEQPQPWRGRELTLSDLRFFIHDVRLVDAAGNETPAAIDPVDAFHTPDVAMIDLADGTGSCSGAAGTENATLHVRAEAGEYTAIRFRLGVPFALNHADPALAPPPLDQMAMHWGWRAGYRFLKFDADWGDDHVLMHFGSTGCEGPMRAIERCTRPCRANAMAELNSERTIAVEVSGFFGDAEPGPLNCMAAPGTPACTPVLQALALDDATCEPNGTTTVFRAAE